MACVSANKRKNLGIMSPEIETINQKCKDMSQG